MRVDALRLGVLQSSLCGRLTQSRLALFSDGIDTSSDDIPNKLDERAQHVGGISERFKEIKRRRHRRKKLEIFARKLKKATASEKTAISDKIRKLSLGSEQILENFGLAASDR